jgi:phosphatidylglycerophosphate synthase
MAIGQEREKIFDNLAWRLHRAGVRPDHISFLQIPVYATMVAVGWGADTTTERWIFGWLQVLAFLIDGADGILARRTGTVTKHGHLLDSIFDIAGIGLTIWVVAKHHPLLGQWLLALLFVNFLVYLQNEIQGSKSVTYTRGPLTIAFVFELYYPGVLEIGIALPLFFGMVLLFTRVAWRQRVWTWYQFLTAGRRREYKAAPREQRAGLAREDARLGMRHEHRRQFPRDTTLARTGPAIVEPAEPEEKRLGPPQEQEV